MHYYVSGTQDKTVVCWGDPGDAPNDGEKVRVSVAEILEAAAKDFPGVLLEKLVILAEPADWDGGTKVSMFKAVE